MQIGFGNTRDAEGRRESIPFATLIAWPSGKTLDIPKLTMAKRGGWVYKPEGMWTKKDKHFGRGEVGREKAHEYLTEIIREAYEEHDWEQPTFAGPGISKREGSVGTSYYTRFASSYQWETHGFGFIGAALKLVGDELQVHVTLPTALLVDVYPKYKLPIQHPTITVMTVVANDNDIGRFVESWMDNPWKSLTFFPNINGTLKVPNADATTMTNAAFANIMRLLKPKIDFDPNWTEAAESYRETEDGNGWSYGIESSFMLRSKKYRTEVLTHATRKAMEQLSNVMKEYGVDMKLGTTINNEFNSLEFDIPETHDPHNKKGHRFIIRPNGIEVVCGFVTDEDNYVSHQSRLAVDEIAAMLQDDDD